MASARTEYRQMRQRLVKDSVALLLDMLTMQKKDLEAIPTAYFKKLKKAVESRTFE